METTGLADPAPVLHTAMAHPYLVMRFRLDGVVTLVDAVNGVATLDEHPEAVKQAAVADRIVLTKTDLLDTPERRAPSATRWSRGCARSIRRRRSSMPRPARRRRQRCSTAGSTIPARKIPDVSRWLAEEAYAAAAITTTAIITITTSTGTTTASAPSRSRPTRRSRPRRSTCSSNCCARMHGPNLLRMKGIVKLAETPDRPMVMHGVQHVFHPAAQLEPGRTTTTAPAWCSSSATSSRA